MGFNKLWYALSTFQVSQYTDRIHLYSCIPGKDLRPRPLFENFRPEELEPLNSPAAEKNKGAPFTSLKDNPAYRHVLVAFVNEWNRLRPIDRRKLLGKCLQLPLTLELCYLSDSINHNNGVCLIDLNSDSFLDVTVYWFSNNSIVLYPRDCWRVEASDARHLYMRLVSLYLQMLCGKRLICVVDLARRRKNTVRVGPWQMNLSVNSVRHRASKSR